MTVSVKPNTVSAQAAAMTRCRRAGVRVTWCRPAVSSVRQFDRHCCDRHGCDAGSRTRSISSETTGTTNVAASRIATTCPPPSTNSPAPVSGPASRSDSCTVRSAPLASASRSVGSTVVSSADWAAASTE
jgi:hypothetical protein